MFFKVTFHLDGSGVYYDPNEPIHLDALLAWCLAPIHCKKRHITRNDIPEEVSLPLRARGHGKRKVWKASALFPEGPQGEDVQYWRKKFRQSRADITTGSPNLTMGKYREWNMPIPLTLTTKLVAYADGNRCACKKLLRQVTHLGKKRAHGHGKIVGLDFDHVDDDYSIMRDGFAMRWLPIDGEGRLVRAKPPYWHPHDRVTCCDVGDVYALRESEER